MQLLLPSSIFSYFKELHSATSLLTALLCIGSAERFRVVLRLLRSIQQRALCFTSCLASSNASLLYPVKYTFQLLHWICSLPDFLRVLSLCSGTIDSIFWCKSQYRGHLGTTYAPSASTSGNSATCAPGQHGRITGPCTDSCSIHHSP